MKIATMDVRVTHRFVVDGACLQGRPLSHGGM